MPGGGAPDERGEPEEPQLAQRRAAECGEPVDRGREDVAHVGGLQRQRAAAAAGPESDEDHGRGDHPEEGGRVVEVTGGDPRRAVTGHRGGTEDQATGDEGGEVGPVHGIDPVDVGQPLAAAEGLPVRQRAFEVDVVGDLDEGSGAGQGSTRIRAFRSRRRQ